MIHRPIHILCRALPPLLRQPAFAILPAGFLAPAGHFTGCEQPAHNRISGVVYKSDEISVLYYEKKYYFGQKSWIYYILKDS